MKPKFTILFLLFVFTVSYGLDKDTAKVKYTADFSFTEGIYLSFKQVKENNPIPKSRILTSVSFNSSEFFDKITKSQYLYYYDDWGTKQEVRLSEIWGYSRNGVLYINMNGDFYRVTIVGNICHFLATYTNYYNDVLSPYQGGSVGYYGSDMVSTPTSEVRQYILDFKSGKVFDYYYKNLEVLLTRDPELHDEYMSLRRKKKKQLMFYYIRKFNERNPLYFSAE